MRYFILLPLLFSINSFSQSPNFKLTSEDTLLTCGLTNRGIITGPFLDSHSSEFENLVAGVFKASRFPAYPYSIYHMKDAGYLRMGCQQYDETDYYTFFLYNLDSIMEFNLKARTKYGLMSIIAHEVGHHAFNHFLRSQQSIQYQELQADYFAGFTMAAFNVPRKEVTNGIALVTKNDVVASGYPSRKERLNTTLLGYDVGMQSSEVGPLSVLNNQKTLSDVWLKKWSRKIKKVGDHVPVTDGIFDTDSKFVLDKLGQFIYQHNNQNFVIARAIPSKDQRYPYMIFDNYFNYWWLDREGMIRDSTELKAIGRVNVNVLK